MYNLHRHRFGRVTGGGGARLSQAGLLGEFMLNDPGDTATSISPLIVDWSKRPQTGAFLNLFFPMHIKPYGLK